MSVSRIKRWVVSRRARRYTRCARIVGLSLAMALCTVGLYLNRVGLPQSIRIRIEKELRDRGVDVRFGSLRLCGFRTLVMEDLEWRAAGNRSQILAEIREGELRLSVIRLLALDIVPESLAIKEGTVEVPLRASGDEAGRFTIDNISAVIRFLPDDRWELEDLRANAALARIRVSGTIDHASAVRRAGRARLGRGISRQWQDRVKEWIDRLPEHEVIAPADVSIRFRGDASNWEGSEVGMEFQVPQMTVSSGVLEDVRGAASLSPADGEEVMVVKIRVFCERADSKFGMFRGASLGAEISGVLGGSTMNRCDWSLEFTDIDGSGSGADDIRISGTTSRSSNGAFAAVTHVNARAASVNAGGFGIGEGRLDLELFHSRTNFPGASGDWNLSVNRLTSKWGKSDRLDLAGELVVVDRSSDASQSEQWSLPKILKSARLNWSGRMDGVRISELDLGRVEATGEWTAPNLTVELVHRDEDGQGIAVSTRFDSEAREIKAGLESDFNPHKIASLLTPNTQRWLRQFSWAIPPVLSAEARLALPLKKQEDASWSEFIAEHLIVNGALALGAGAFRGASFTSALSDFSFSNLNWHLPNLTVTRPEGESKLDYRVNAKTRDYVWKVSGRVMPGDLKTMLEESGQSAFDYFEFSEPLDFQGTIRGRWRERERLRGELWISLEDFAFRGETCDALSASLAFRNPMLTLTDVSVRRGGGAIQVKRADYDLGERTITVTNAVSSVDPDVITRWIGPEVHQLLQPYSFADPPTVVLDGRLPVGRKEGADARFQISGESFRYWRFSISDFAADLHWREQSLSITNLDGSFYEGNLIGGGNFDFSIPDGAKFQFQGLATGANLQSLASDVTQTHSELQGLLSGKLVVTSAESEDWKSWQGYGDATVREGALWSIPIVGVFSPIINRIAPGLGSSQAGAASATFRIDKSVILTSDLEVKAPALRLAYDGSVDFDGNVDATMRAEILRDMWGVGRMVSIAFWPLTKTFEYRVTGTLREPRSVPHFVPRILLLPFQPLKTIKEILAPDRALPILTPLPDQESSAPPGN